ncbi:hypothetical protein ACA910_022573 [Epithemia clementina (nom. ined.)]
MYLGDKFVAVKVYKQKSWHSFAIEEPIWHALEGYNVTPHLLATGTAATTTKACCGDNKIDPKSKFSYIITEVGVPLEKFFPELTDCKRKPKVNPFLPFLNMFDCYPLEEFPMEYQPFRPKSSAELWKLKARLIHGMILCQERLEQAGIVHRDLKVSNFVQLWNGDVWLIDFGLAQRQEDMLDPSQATPRGSIRMYPLIAVDSFYYD